MPKSLQSKILIYLLICFFPLVSFSQSVADSASGSNSRFVVKITRTWSLPAVLREISGISYIDSERLACVEDETGSIYIYNLSGSVIEATINFGPPGDYEGLAVVGDDAYVLSADGRILEVAGYRSPRPVSREYGTHLTVKQNLEGLCYDKKNKRLLIAIKGQEEGGLPYKGIYEFDLVAKKIAVKPAFRIDLQDVVFNRFPTKKLQSVMQPSDLDIHPLNRDLYITDGVKSQLLIMNSAGKIKALYALDKKEVIQPEGICFTPSGELYIASEGKKGEAAKLFFIQLP